MAGTVTAIDAEALGRARDLLDRPKRRERIWPVLAAAAAFAVSALMFATAMIAAPPLASEHPGHVRSIQ